MQIDADELRSEAFGTALIAVAGARERSPGIEISQVPVASSAQVERDKLLGK